jgi:hypothetical protein
MHMKKSSVPVLPHYPMVQQIEQWPVEKLIPYAKNPRTHSDGQVGQIAASIAEFGFNNPILVDTHAGIIAGHGRLLAARKLEIQEVRVFSSAAEPWSAPEARCGRGDAWQVPSVALPAPSPS